MALAYIALSAYAQDSIPNGNFESWTSTTIDNPTNYPYTSNENAISANQPTNVVKTTDAYHGQTAIQLSTISTQYGSNLGYFLNADSKKGNISLWTNGMPYTEKPIGIRGYYKYNVATADSGMIIAIFRKNSSTIGTYMIRIGGVKDTYTLFNIPFVPALTQTPDSVIFGAVSSNFYKNNNGVAGSILKLDSVSFTGVTNQPTAMDGDFELWTQTQSPYIIVGWNEKDKQLSGIARTTDAKTGLSALQLTTTLGDQNGTPRAQPGSVSTGYYDSGCNCQKGGKAYSSQKDTLAFWYKYAPVSTDNAEVSLSFFKNGTSIAWESQTLTASPNYQYIEKPFQIGQTPDTVIVQIQSSLWANSAETFVGSVLKIDNMYFKSKLHTGLFTPSTNEEVYILPNASSGKFTITNNIAGTLSFDIYNVTGTKLQLKNQISNEIDITNAAKGMYFVRIYIDNKSYVKKILKL